MKDGGYEDGYRKCSCFWGKKPGRLVIMLETMVASFEGFTVLDAGCGEGKNAVYLAKKGAMVHAVDISISAIKNAHKNWPGCDNVLWFHRDMRSVDLERGQYDLVIAYGLLHCLTSEAEIAEFVQRMQTATKPGGYHAVCAYNSRQQDLSGHPGASPTLASHMFYEALYNSWELKFSTDENLHETHPHNNIPHCHSMTRIIARCPP